MYNGLIHIRAILRSQASDVANNTGKFPFVCVKSNFSQTANFEEKRREKVSCLRVV